MSTKNLSNNKPEYPIFEMVDHGKLILPQHVINQITYLHSYIGKKEWSGILLYDVVKGNPSKPSEFVLRAEHIFLMDIGSAAFTQYETDGDIVDIYDNIDRAMEMKIGHVHTHHDMSAYFSSTDTDELMQNSDKHNYYLSLIVNFSSNYVAKVAFISENNTTSQMHYIDDNGRFKKFTQKVKEKNLVTINMDIVLEYSDKFFYDRIKQVEKKIEDKNKKEIASRTKYQPYKTSKYDRTFVQRSFMDEDRRFYEDIKSTKVNSETIDPENMTDAQIELLTASLLSLDKNLTETRSVYKILSQLYKSDEGELDSYYDYFFANFDEIIDEFFDDTFLDLGEPVQRLIFKEIIMSLRRYEEHVAFKEIVERLVKIIETYIEYYFIEKEQDDLKREFDAITK